MRTMEAGFDSGEKPLLHVCAYVSFQEVATRVSHRNTGRITEDPVAERLLVARNLFIADLVARPPTQTPLGYGRGRDGPGTHDEARR